MATWEPQYLPLTSQLLEDMVTQQWVTRDELSLWLEDQLPPEIADRIDNQVNLARMILNAQVPVQ